MWFIKQLIGIKESVISDDSSDSDSDYSLEPRPGSKRATVSNVGTQIIPDEELVNTISNLSLNEGTEVASADDITKASDLDVTTDAAMKTCHFPKPEVVLSQDKVLHIEKELEVYEIVSLVYLLYKDAQYALQELTLLLKGAQKNLLYDWAIVEANCGANWQKKMIEALCIIKNYQILKSLGYQKQDLIVHYLPRQPKTVASISSIKKTLYLICEKLDEQKTHIFLQQVRLNFQEKKLPFEEYDRQYLELYFLKWETMKYISATDLSNIKRVLKVMNEDLLYDYLNSVFPPETSQIENSPVQPNVQVSEIAKKPSKNRKPSTSVDTHHLRSSGQIKEKFDNYQFPLPSIGRDNANTSRKNHDENHVYNINPENPGLLLIINQKHFYKEIDEKFKNLLPTDVSYKFEIRNGTEKDSEDLSAVFKKFGFNVIIKNDLNHEDMIAEIKEVVKSIRDESSLFICIMSHGDKGIVYGVNSCKVKVSKIQEIMCKTNKEFLTGKPKILILQSCQGKMCQKLNESSEDDEDENYTMTIDGANSSKQPRTVDMLTFWATVPGYAAIRNKRTGSWFIQALCKKMEENGNKHFADICTRIVNDVSDKVWTVEENDHAMTPMVVTTLRKDFYLPPMRNV